MKRIFLLLISTVLILSYFGCSKNTHTNNIKEVNELHNNFKLELPNELENYRDKFEKSIKPFVKITAKQGKTLAWESKFGGNPYLPLGYEYPKDLKGNSMRLLAQINFDEVPDISLFPSKGILQFYISEKDDVYGINFDNPTAQENFKVIYIPEVIKDNSKIMRDFSFINNSDEDYFPIGTECKLQFKIEYEPVGSEDFQFEKLFDSAAYSFFDEIDKGGDQLWDWYDQKYTSAGHKMGGYAYFTQSDPREDKYTEYDMLLLQIDTDDELDIMWGDCGVANFFIKPEDLKNLDFTKVLYNWDCC